MHKSALSKGRKFGYCAGIATDSILYNMYYTYYLFFLTDVAHMSAGLAGTVSLISVIWDAVTDPIIGHFADKPGADKRKFMLRAAFPVGITFVAAFLPLGERSDAFKFIFYTAMTMLFWLAYTVYTIPYYAVVAEITEDYDERTSIRATSSMCNNVCIFIGNAVPSVLPALFVGMGLTLAGGWITTAAILSVFAVAFGVAASLCLRGVELKTKRAESENQKASFKEYFEILKLKPFRSFVIFVFFFLMASSMLQTNFAYLVQGRLGMSSDDMVIVIVVLVVTMAIMTPIVAKVSEKTDRRTASLIFISITFVSLIVMKIVGINGVVTLIAEVVCCGIGLACFWTVFYSMAYDIVEVDEFINSKRREGMITAFPQFFQKFGSAIGMWIAGQVLDFAGYNGAAEVQTEAAKNAIENIATIIPCIFLAFSIIGLILYPVTKERFVLLTEKLIDKRQGKETDTSGLEKLI
ncbi:MAG: MFS transporter [Acutalibacteraceae bacterium]